MKSNHPLNILFMGTGDIALPAFSALIESPHRVIGLVTQPDKPVGRKQVLTAPKIKNLALANEISVFQPVKAKSKSFIDQVESLAPDIIVVMAYGQILTSRLIKAPKIAIINVHASLLPLYRGASCIQGPIADGKDITGVTIMHVVKELDAGDIILQKETKITSSDTGGSVHDRLAEMSPSALLQAIEKLALGNASRTPQEDAASTYAPKLLRNDGLLDLAMTSEELVKRIHAYHPWPGTYLIYLNKKGKEKRLKVFPPAGKAPPLEESEPQSLSLPCGENELLHLYHVQAEGSKPMNACDFLKGDPFGSQGFTQP